MAPKQKYNTRLEAAAERAAAVQEKKEQNALKKKVDKEDPKITVPKPTTSFMDPKLWGSLQHHIDLLEHVYCRLSLEAFFELRAVCKAWYAVACRRMALRSSLPKPFFPLYTRGGRFYRLDGILTWNKSVKAKPPRRRSYFMGQMEPRPLHPSLVYKPSWVWKRRGDSQDLVPSSHQFVANEGLVCSHRPGYGQHGLAVHVHDWNLPEDKNHVPRSFRCNVRSRHVAQVPHNGRMQTVLGMLVCFPPMASGLHPFKLVLGCLELDTLVYDSERQSWESQPCRPKVRGDLLHPTTGCAACNGRVFITQEFSREILVYDFESASWSSIDAPAPTAGGAVVTSMQSQHYCNDTLGAWNGRILDVVDGAESSDSLSLWELVDEETWRVFDRMPEDLYKLWLRGRDDPADQLRNEALLTIHSSFCGDYVLVYSWVFKYEWARRFCLYNMATKVWQKLQVDAKTVFIKRRRGSDDWDGWDE